MDIDFNRNPLEAGAVISHGVHTGLLLPIIVNLCPLITKRYLF